MHNRIEAEQGVARRILMTNRSVAGDGSLHVERLMALAFFPGRAPRSQQYMEGCRAALVYRIAGKRMYSPWAEGSAESDAWFAGAEEGHSIGRKLYDTM